uniref:Uncharacterized protein n=1 Tax=Aureimonas frigidaquae TaxID=424757 RepID=A0A0P0Z0N0_9HYPH|nr:hypothetical protein [Aureimonas frigidaquae]BAT27396.1 hypothetical protein [Aureimonas frigidaquae]
MDAFGSERPNIVGVLVIGRSSSLSTAVRKDRWEWRRNKVKADSFTLTLVTFDELYQDFETWIGLRKMEPAVPMTNGGFPAFGPGSGQGV